MEAEAGTRTNDITDRQLRTDNQLIPTAFMRTQETTFSRWLGSFLFVAALAWPTCLWAQVAGADAEPAAADAAPPDPIADAPADEPADEPAMDEPAMDEPGADEPGLGEDQPAEP